MKLAIHTVFIIKENIFFLEQWIDYHIQVGFNKFYLYDNSKVMRSGGCHPKHKCFVAGKVNKYGIDYDRLIKEHGLEGKLDEKVSDILNKYKGIVEIIEWSPKNKDGVILHNQKEAHDNCLQLMKIDVIEWCANVDMDEYIVCNNIKEYIESLDDDVGNIKMSQILFDSRFNNMDKKVIEITKACHVDLDRNHSNKNIYKIKNTNKLTVHGWSGVGKEHIPALSECCFNHYKLKKLTKFRIIDNIPIHIKDVINK